MKGIKMGNSRLRYIDIAKGIAIICIILGHLGNSNINRFVYTFHVTIFYLITGYFISTKRPVKDFVKVKFRTLIVPYILTCIVIITLGTLKGLFNGHTISNFITWSYASLYGAGDSYTSPFYIYAIGGLWFLWAAFWGSCFLRISLNYNKYVRLAFIVCLFIVGYYSRSICWFPLSVQAGACATLFMYMGFLYRNSKDTFSKVPDEVKCFGIVFAVVTWVSFIKDFSSFWLVHCDIGRGIVDIFGSICACSVVVLISMVIDSKTNFISGFLSYFGRYSLLVLCVHMIEVNLCPWWIITQKLIQYGMPATRELAFIIFAKFIFVFTCVYVLSKITFVKKLYGIG